MDCFHSLLSTSETETLCQNKTKLSMPSVNVPFAQKICLDDQVLPSGTSRHDMCM